jgi:hypothetical protein
MTDRATEWSGKVFGLATGLVGGIAVWLLSQAWRVCSADQFGPKTDYILSDPFASMATPATLSTSGLYCQSALGSDLIAVLPWIVGVVLGLGGYFVGDALDKRKVASR